MSDQSDKAGEALKECPYCGGDAYDYKDDPPTEGHFVTCRECDATSAEFNNRASAIAAWNRRSPAVGSQAKTEGDGVVIVPTRSAHSCGGCGMDLTNWPTNATSHHCTGRALRKDCSEEGWIPVSKRVPDEPGKYLATKELKSGERIVVPEFFDIHGYWISDGIVAWRKEIEPYQKGDSP